MDQEAFRKLLDAYYKGQASDEERELVELHFANYLKQERILPEPERVQHAKKRGWQKLMHEWDFPVGRPSTPFLVKYRTAAVAALLLVALATALYFIAGNRKPEAESITATEILPGYNQATLTLADGTKINLDSAKSGIQIRDEDISYNDGSKLSAVLLSEAEASHKPDETHSTHSASAGSAQGDVLLQLSTPKGGQYQIILSDGTKVWLNAASTLKYPPRFSGETRTVELEGEAYFEIKGDKTNPFKVLSKSQEIAVLGTGFNVNSYDPVVRTTLADGSIQVSTPNMGAQHCIRLSPGEQSIVSGDGITKARVDVSRETAWKNGDFDFTGKDLKQVMQELQRWYNLDIVYEAGVPDMRFEGRMPRSLPLSKVLKVLESVEVTFRAEQGRKLIITKPSQK